MRPFLPSVAVAVGLAHALLYNALGNSPWGGPFVWNIRTGPLFIAEMVSAVVAGLIVSGSLLMFANRKLRGRFFDRYVLMVAAICAGGAILGVFLHFSIILIDEREPTLWSVDILFRLAFSALAGCILGVIEGVYLGFPLAWMLGPLRGRTVPRTGDR